MQVVLSAYEVFAVDLHEQVPHTIYASRRVRAHKHAIINRYRCAELIYIVCVCVCVCVGTTGDPADGGATAVNDCRKRLP